MVLKTGSNAAQDKAGVRNHLIVSDPNLRESSRVNSFLGERNVGRSPENVCQGD